VIEGRAAPALGRMTSATILTELSVMGIIVRMAGVTGSRGALVNAIYMAGCTSGISVLPGQWEAGL